MDKQNVFGKNLKMLRDEKGIGQVALAEALNVSKGTISLWENGVKEPKMSSLITIADFFGCSIDWLTGREE